MKTILMFSPNDLDGVSLYRHAGPMYQLEKQGKVKLQFMDSNALHVPHWPFYKKSHLAFISRPAKKHDYLFMKECQKHGLPMWIDIDDNLFSVPDDNDAFEYYSGKENQEILLYALKNAQIVSVATVRLQKFLKNNFKIDAVLLDNALDDSLVKMKKTFKRKDEILWRGSRSHLSDLLYYEYELLELIQDLKGYHWLFLGMNPFFLTRRFEVAPIQWSRSFNFIDYITEITKINRPFTFFSMIDSEFNRTRSHNGWLETTLGGSVALAPDWESWQLPGITHYSKKSDFKLKFMELINSTDSELHEKHKLSWQFILDNLLLSKINEKRMEIINNL